MAVRTLNVYLHQAFVGQLVQDRSGTMSFSYDEAWLNLAGAVPLSHSLPLQRGSFGRNACRPFFAGLLPEEESRRLIAKSFGVSDRNDFALLERIGAECAGAVSLLKPEEEPVAAATSEYHPISLAQLAGKFAELPRRPLLAGEAGIRLSLAGAQGKVVVAVRDGNYALPIGGSPSTHILKPASPHFTGLVENEFFCLKLALRAGLDVAQVELGQAENVRFLQVLRFDRSELPDGQLVRIHQEDFCQALGIPPELKYQQEGGPNLEACFELVRQVSTSPVVDVLKLFYAVGFNFLVGNGDAHGKNFSFLYTEEGARLAPLYDLVCTRLYPSLDQTMAMKIGGERDPARLQAKHWRKFIQEAGLGEKAALKRLVDLAKWVQSTAKAMIDRKVVGSDTVGPLVLANCQRLVSLHSASG